MKMGITADWVLTLSSEEMHLIVKALQGGLDEPTRQKAEALAKEIKRQDGMVDLRAYLGRL